MQPDAKQVLQLAYVVIDLDAAVQRWLSSLGCGPFLVRRHLTVSEGLYRGRPSNVDFSMAVAQAGPVQIELIQQHDDAPSCYRDLVPAGREGFHHVAMITPDFDAEVARYVAQGFEVASSGLFGDVRFAYVDTSPAVGHMVELLEDKPSIRAYFDSVKRKAGRWDGVTDPVRSM
jgi:hypothetical protein